MNADVKAKWVAALRSGKYRQGKNALRYDFGEGSEFCCLGVLCDLHDSSLWDKKDARMGVYTYESSEGHRVGFDLPQNVRDWAGIPEADPNVWDNGALAKLSQLNDFGRTFDEIATLIEESL